MGEVATNDKIYVGVATEGCGKDGCYYAYLKVANQRFEIMPVYREGEDEDPRDCAEHMAHMLRKAVQRIVRYGFLHGSCGVGDEEPSASNTNKEVQRG